MQIISLSVGSIKIIDSYNFLPMALSAIPSSMGITELSKGYFPHLANTENIKDEEIEWPDAFLYQPAQMKKKTYEDFMKWYNQQKNKVMHTIIVLFNF